MPTAAPIEPWSPSYVCAGCGAVVASDAAPPFRCPAPDGPADHVVSRRLPLCAGALPWPPPPASQPFVRFRWLSSAWHEARNGGLSDADFIALVEELDEAIARVDGAGFTPTPLIRLHNVERALGWSSEGRLLAKVDACNVAGSHKARHLMGLMIQLRVREALVARRGEVAPPRPTLAIASCGNAALAAAVVARAARWPLAVYVPPHTDARILARLTDLGAGLQPCPRLPGELGDPCYLRFRAALERGALPFCCQGTDNGLTIEGGATLAWELACDLATSGVALDDVIVQVGGGALLSATVQGLREVCELGGLAVLPRFWAVQTKGAWPLRRAWQRALDDIGEACATLPADASPRQAGNGADAEPGASVFPPEDQMLARMAWVAANWQHAAVRLVRERMRSDRGRYMWPWETEPHSVAEGILDDETYDWRVCVEALLETGGAPLVVDEDTLVAADNLADRDAGMTISATGSAGLAGLLHLDRLGVIDRQRRVAVLFTGRG